MRLHLNTHQLPPLMSAHMYSHFVIFDAFEIALALSTSLSQKRKKNTNEMHWLYVFSFLFLPVWIAFLFDFLFTITSMSTNFFPLSQLCELHKSTTIRWFAIEQSSLVVDDCYSQLDSIHLRVMCVCARVPFIVVASILILQIYMRQRCSLALSFILNFFLFYCNIIWPNENERNKKRINSYTKGGKEKIHLM